MPAGYERAAEIGCADAQYAHKDCLGGVAQDDMNSATCCRVAISQGQETELDKVVILHDDLLCDVHQSTTNTATDVYEDYESANKLSNQLSDDPLCSLNPSSFTYFTAASNPTQP